MTTAAMDKPVPQPAASDLYRAVWRWHFYEGLLVLPFLISMAFTGGLYLFKDEIDGIVHADLKKVMVQETTLMPSRLIDAALAAHPGTAIKFTDPATPDISAEITIRADNGERLAVYVDQYTGKVLGSLSDRGTVMWTVRYLHSLRYFGPIARGMIEIAGGWSILLVATGVYLWWPRKKGRGGVISVRGKPENRMFWRDTHAVLGIFAGFFIVFLASTGMPWSNVWGSKVNELANGSNYGYPSGVRIDVPMSQEKIAHSTLVAWSLEQAREPMSDAAGSRSIGIDRAVAALHDSGLHRGFAVSLPNSRTDVYTGSVFPDDLARQRVVHLDQYSGQPLLDVSYGDYGPLARWLEFGISVHMGQYFGLANQMLLAAVCLSIIALAVSAAIMWWKRRPDGSLGVPPLPSDQRVFRGIIAILALGGLVFPLVGASLIVMLALDWTIRQLPQPRLM